MPSPKNKLKLGPNYYVNLDPVRQCLHIRIMKDTHAALRILCLQRKVSVQEVIDEMCNLLITGDPFIEQMFDGITQRKKARIYRQLTMTDTESIFDAIDMESPLGQENERRKK